MRRLTDRQKELLTGISVPLAALLVLALGELVMRAVHQLRYGTGQGIEDDSLWRDDPLTGVRVPRPGASMGNIEINALGFRGPELEAEKAPGLVRVLFMGGSTTYDPRAAGNGAAWPHRVVEELRAELPEMRFDYINGGLPAITVADCEALYEAHFAPLAPDLVLIGAGPYDLNCAVREAAAEQGLEGSALEMGPDWIARSELLSWLYKNAHVRRLQRDALNAEDVLQVDTAALVEPFIADLAELSRRCAASGARVVLSTACVRIRPEQEPREQARAAATTLYNMAPINVGELAQLYEAYNAAVREVAAQQGHLLLDMQGVIPADELHYADTLHYRAAGSRLHARLVSEQLLAEVDFAALR